MYVPDYVKFMFPYMMIDLLSNGPYGLIGRLEMGFGGYAG